MEFRILGPLEVVEGDRQIPLGGRKPRALLAMLILRRGQIVSVAPGHTQPATTIYRIAMHPQPQRRG